MPETKKNGANGIMHELGKAAVKEQFVSKESVKSYLKKDLTMIHVLLMEILSTEEVLDAITEVIYTRYEKIREAKDAAPELFEE